MRTIYVAHPFSNDKVGNMARAGQRGVYAGKWQDYIKNWWFEYEA